jgi:hypothetical protein
MKELTTIGSKVFRFITLGQFVPGAWIGQLAFVIFVLIGSSLFFSKEERKQGRFKVVATILAIVEMLSLVF